MTQEPYTKGDSFIFNYEYEIVNLKATTKNYWLYEGIQKIINKEVRIKVYNNKSYSSVFSAEHAWMSEVKSLQIEAEQPDLPGKYLESGVDEIIGEKRFIIIFELEALTNTDDSEVLKSSLPKKPSSSQPVGAVFEKLKDLREEREIVQPSVDESSDLDEFDKPEEIELAEEFVGLEPEPSPAEEFAETKEKEEICEPSDGMGGPPSEFKPTPPTAAPPSVALDEKRKSKPSKALRKKEQFKQIDKEISEKKVEEEKDYLKHISMEYFDRMNPENYYPMIIDITDILKERKNPVINPITGERKIQKQSEMDVTMRNPIVTVRPTIPGCSVVPSKIDTDFSLTKDKLTFFITPGVKGKILGHIKFINEEQEIHAIDLEAKVVDPRIARLVAMYGILASFIPKIISLLGINLGLNSTLNELWSVAEETFGGMNIASLIALGGIIPVIAASFGIRHTLKPKSTKIKYKLTDFKLKDVKPSSSL